MKMPIKLIGAIFSSAELLSKYFPSRFDVRASLQKPIRCSVNVKQEQSWRTTVLLAYALFVGAAFITRTVRGFTFLKHR